MEKLEKSNSEWKKLLKPMQFNILREGGTEKAFTGILLDNKEKGVYLCLGCGNKLFSSSTKYDSGTGWPSFFAPYSEESVIIIPGPHGLSGSEVRCAKCGGHHGHVFSDEPTPTGARFCMNSEVLKFKKN